METKHVVAGFLFLAFSVLVAGFAQANHFSICSPGCNTTTMWWNDTTSLSGVGTSLGAVTARIDGATACTTTADGLGSWNCSFRAPGTVGRYNLSVTVDSVTDDSVLTVKPSYGQVPAGNTPRYVLEIPNVVQEPSGRMRTLINRLVVSRGGPN